jgi:hypothetical protein
MKIKDFIRSSALAGMVAALCLTLTVLPLSGCDTQATLAELVQTLGSADGQVANLQGNVQLAAQINTDTTAAVNAITNWKNGTPAQDVIEALNIVEDDLNLIPAASQYAGLIDIAIATVQTLLALLPAPAPTVAVAQARTAHASVPHRTVNVANPPKTAKQFKKRWNAMVAANPALAPAAIK